LQRCFETVNQHPVPSLNKKKKRRIKEQLASFLTKEQMVWTELAIYHARPSPLIPSSQTWLQLILFVVGGFLSEITESYLANNPSNGMVPSAEQALPPTACLSNRC
jgi:hypothetical protein